MATTAEANQTSTTEAWEKAARASLAKHGVTGWSVLDIPLDRAINLHQYATGSYALVETDLQAVLEENDWLEVERVFREAHVETAFNIRSQAINLKKLCLHLYHYCEQDLKKYITRSTHVFYYHNYTSVNAVKQALPEGCRDWLSLYKESSNAYQKLKGVSRVIYDMRFVLKQICCIPRHPKQPVLDKLLDIPNGLLFYISVKEACRMLLKLHKVEVTLDAFVVPLCYDKVEVEESIVEELEKIFGDGCKSKFVYKVMIARGITKAIRIVQHLKIFVAAYDHVMQCAQIVITALRKQLAVVPTDRKDLAKETKRQIELLSHSLTCAKQMHAVLKQILERPNCVSFAASDDTVHSQGAVFLAEDEFSVVSETFTFANGILSKHMPILSQVATISKDMQAEHPNEGKAGILSLSGPHKCVKCSRGFSKHWLVRQVCPSCDMAMRKALLEKQREAVKHASSRYLLECPYKQRCSRASVHTLCPHRARCFACDRWSCKDCGIFLGDAEFVSSFARGRTPPPDYIFCDFDRTFATTRKGSSPSSSKKKHSVDPTLRALALNHPNFHILTRNSHEQEINTFLTEHGLSNVTVHCIRNLDKEKHEVIAEYCPKGGAKNALLVDDDVTEVCDPNLVAQDNVSCILFSRLLQ